MPVERYATAPEIIAIQFTTLFSFNGFTGVGSAAGLIADANGNLFGTTNQGGVNNYGTVFEIQNIGTVRRRQGAGTKRLIRSTSWSAEGGLTCGRLSKSSLRIGRWPTSVSSSGSPRSPPGAPTRRARYGAAPTRPRASSKQPTPSPS